MLRKTAGGPQPRQRDIIRPAVTASKQHRARELLQTADSALPVDGEFAMGGMHRAACSVASFCGHWWGYRAVRGLWRGHRLVFADETHRPVWGAQAW